MAGPGHGAPGVLGPTYLEGTYSEVYPDKSQDMEGLEKFFKQFSFPGHIGSHVTLKHPAPFTRVANSGTAFRMLTALVWTIQILSLHAWWEMAKPKPDHLRPPGTPINSLILFVMGRYYQY